MDVEKASLCNCVVNFLLEENYLLTAFELLHELLEDGRESHAIRLKDFFADSNKFPRDHISSLHNLRLLDPQSLLEEKEAAYEKAAITQYELRLAQEDIMKLKMELEKKAAALSTEDLDVSGESHVLHRTGRLFCQQLEEKSSFSNMGPLKENERRDLNCAVKEYLLSAGYKLTAMTFYEEVTDQDLNVWSSGKGCVPDALRRYYLQYISSSADAGEERMAILQERNFLMEKNNLLQKEKEALYISKELADAQINALGKSFESAQKELKDKENQIQNLKQLLELAQKEVNVCRSEVTSLKLQLESSRASSGWDNSKGESLTMLYEDELDACKPEFRSLKLETANLNEKKSSGKPECANQVSEDKNVENLEVEIHEDKPVNPSTISVSTCSDDSMQAISSEKNPDKCKESQIAAIDSSSVTVNGANVIKKDENAATGDGYSKSENNDKFIRTDWNSMPSPNISLETVQVLADALPKIVPYVLINHREELLPLIICAIERHPDSGTRDSLTHTLFNLIKRPDEQQRRIIMDACLVLSKNVGEMRTETELLPQCWEQINHKYEERRLLVAQSCGELAKFVRSEIRTSLILSIVQQLLEDSAAVVREAAAHNLALLLPLFPNIDKYFKVVEEMMFQLVCDPSGTVVETTLKELVPTVVSWGNRLDNVLHVLLSHLLASAQRCPPLSGVDGSAEACLRVLGERERWNIDVLLRMLMELLPVVRRKVFETCPFPGDISSTPDADVVFFSKSLLEVYAREENAWPSFDWMHMDCLPALIGLASLLPSREDSLRTRIAKLLLTVSELFGEYYVNNIMLPVFLTALGDNVGTLHVPSSCESRIRDLKPKTKVAERLSVICVLPLLLTGVLGVSCREAQLADYLRSLILRNTLKHGAWTSSTSPELIDAVRFLCTFEEHHRIIISVLWEMVVSTNANVKISAVNLLQVLVPYVDMKVASTQILPALVTLGSDPNLMVKYSSIDAFGTVAKHFKNEVIVDKIRIQMDAFLEDGSHEAAVAVVRALSVAVPLTTERLRDYLLQKLLQLTAAPVHGSDLVRRRERVNAFCEAIRALDATELAPASVRELLLPAIQNLLKDPESLDPAHKEALEVIMKERSGGTLEALTKVMGSHLSMTSVSHLGMTSVTSLFGDSGLLGKKDMGDVSDQQVSQYEDNRFRRIMRGNFSEMIRGKGKVQEENIHTTPT
uniref:HEAT repeat-containing protein n=1 Tax=Cupressus sempervirens TaxID=13469 RepID=A0A3S6N4E0_CUPSE|nr:HEAT repeat-containing protein [Cupressus sempervirens]